MGFQIIENVNGYEYNQKKYKWGDGLVEFINYDFSEFINCINSIENNAEKQIECEINEVNIYEFYKPLLEFQTNSLHINLLIDYLLDFFHKYKFLAESFEEKNHNINDLLTNLQWNFKFPIKIKQADYKSIIKNSFSSEKNILSEVSINKLNKCISKQTDFPAITKELKSFKKNGIIEYELTFYKIEEFCKYEFFKMLENNISILQCPNCNTFFIPNEGKAIYCSSKCQKEYNNNKSKNDPYRNEYNKKIKPVYNYCNYYKISKDERKQILEPFKKVFDKYKQDLNEKLDLDNFNKFVKELEKVFIEFTNNKK